MSDAKPVITLPEGRLLWGALFKRDIYKDPKTGAEGKPAYKVQMGISPDGADSLTDAIADALEDKYGPDVANAWIDGKDNVMSPFKEGDDLAAAKEAAGKKGDAYKGLMIFSAETLYNADGQEADGGIEVYDEQVNRVLPASASTVYNGSYGMAAVQIHVYDTTVDVRANGRIVKEKVYKVKFRLKGYQKTRDGDKLASQGGGSVAGAFKPVGRAPEADGGRRRRAA